MPKSQRENIGTKNKKKVHISGVIYSSVNDACINMDICYNTLSNRIKSTNEKYKDWYYVSNV
jgi:hypothetical protein